MQRGRRKKTMRNTHKHRAREGGGEEVTGMEGERWREREKGEGEVHRERWGRRERWKVRGREMEGEREVEREREVEGEIEVEWEREGGGIERDMETERERKRE